MVHAWVNKNFIELFLILVLSASQTKTNYAQAVYHLMYTHYLPETESQKLDIYKILRATPPGIYPVPGAYEPPAAHMILPVPTRAWYLDSMSTSCDVSDQAFPSHLSFSCVCVCVTGKTQERN